ncbi:MAG: hypothetical protein QM811_09965 [Pirellulales bacterium]
MPKSELTKSRISSGCSAGVFGTGIVYGIANDACRVLIGCGKLPAPCAYEVAARETSAIAINIVQSRRTAIMRSGGEGP